MPTIPAYLGEEDARARRGRREVASMARVEQQVIPVQLAANM